MKGLFFAFLTLIFCSGYFPCAATELPKVSDVSGIIHKVNRYWQTTHPKHSWSFWDHAAYHTGNMEAYFLTGDTAYYNYSASFNMGCDKAYDLITDREIQLNNGLELPGYSAFFLKL